MTQPEHFFKYVNASTARIILTNHTLRWSAASRFNDPFDLQFDMHVRYDREKLVGEALNELWAIYSGQKEITPRNKIGFGLLQLKQKTPNLPKSNFIDSWKKGLTESLDVQEKTLPELHAKLREGFKTAHVLCLSETPTNILMWSHYAENHTGVVLRFSDMGHGSFLNAARPVDYRANMPLLFDHADMLAFLTGQLAINYQQVFNESVFVKAIDWQYEKEWRVIDHGGGPAEFHDSPVDPSRLTGLYLGCRIADEDRDIVDLAKAINPNVQIYEGGKSGTTFSIEFAELK